MPKTNPVGRSIQDKNTNKSSAQKRARRAALLATAALAPDVVRVEPRPAPVRFASRAAKGARCSERQSDPRHSSPRALQLGTAAAASVSATLVDANLHGEGADPSDTDEPGFRRRKVSQAVLKRLARDAAKSRAAANTQVRYSIPPASIPPRLCYSGALPGPAQAPPIAASATLAVPPLSFLQPAASAAASTAVVYQ